MVRWNHEIEESSSRSDPKKAEFRCRAAATGPTARPRPAGTRTALEHPTGSERANYKENDHEDFDNKSCHCRPDRRRSRNRCGGGSEHSKVSLRGEAPGTRVYRAE